ncbi:glycosyl hydrolase family 28-related protein [Priestia megaterium]
MSFIDGRIVYDTDGKSVLDKIGTLQKNFVSVIQAPFNAKGDGTTDDQAALVAAIDYAYQNNKALHFPDGTYISTGNIPNFHAVRKLGAGVIKRGSDLFYVSPTDYQTNKIYVRASGGSNLNDGLSSTQSFGDNQTAVNILKNYASSGLKGNWEFVLAAGTHAKRFVIPDGLITTNPIKFTGADVGGHPNVPTTIISEGAGKSAVGLLASGGTVIIVQDILFTGFNGSTSSCGISVSEKSSVYTINCHFTDCYFGVSGVHRTATDVKGGIFTNCGFLAAGGGTGAGVRSLQLNNHSIGTQNAGDNTKSPIFRSCNTGILIQELSTGHADWCTFEDCVDAIIARVMARCNMDGSLFKRNQRAVRVDSNAHVYVSSNVQFATGADKNAVLISRTSGGQVTSSNMLGTQDVAYSTGESAFDIIYVNQSFNAVANTPFYTEVLNAPFFDYTPNPVVPIKKLYYKIFGTISGTTDQKKITVRLGNNYANSQFTATETGAFVAEGYIYFVSNTEQFINMKSSTHIGSNRSTNAKATNNMASNVTLTLEAYVFNAADSIKIEVVEVGWAG